MHTLNSYLLFGAIVSSFTLFVILALIGSALVSRIEKAKAERRPVLFDWGATARECNRRTAISGMTYVALFVTPQFAGANTPVWPWSLAFAAYGVWFTLCFSRTFRLLLEYERLQGTCTVADAMRPASPAAE